MVANNLLDTIGERIAVLGPPARSVAGQRSSVAIRRFVEGRTSGSQLRAELALLGYSGLQLERLAISADLELDLARHKTLADVAIGGFRRSLLDAGTLKARLVVAGFTPEAADLMVMEELSKAAKPAQRRSSIGLVFHVPQEAVVPDRPTRRSSIGLLFKAPPAAVIREAAPRRSSIGLRFVVPPEAELPPPPERRSSIGLVLKAPPAAVIREAGARRSSIGLRFKVIPRR